MVKKYSLLQRLAGVPTLDARVNQLEKDLMDSEQEIKNKQYMIDALNQDLEVWMDTAEGYKKDIQFWKNRLYDSLEVPDIKNLIDVDKTTKDLTEIDYPHLPLGLSIVDEYYHLYPYETWEKILALVQSETKEEVGTWRTDVSDCDDFALIMQAAMSLSFIDADAQYQGAFAWARSRGHAYNAFIDDTETIYIFEPQTGDIIGRVDEAPDPWVTLRFEF